jgi:hypothetical protein
MAGHLWPTCRPSNPSPKQLRTEERLILSSISTIFFDSIELESLKGKRCCRQVKFYSGGLRKSGEPLFLVVAILSWQAVSGGVRREGLPMLQADSFLPGFRGVPGRFRRSNVGRAKLRLSPGRPARTAAVVPRTRNYGAPAGPT